MESLQKIENLCKEITDQEDLYREASNRDERFEVKRKILTKLRELERQLNELKETIENSPD